MIEQIIGDNKMSVLKKLFGFDPEQHKVRTEIVAGVTTFLTMAYIMAVNPGIFSALEPLGMPTNSVFTATAIAAFVTMIMMPLSYSISDGIMLGIIVYVLMNVCTGKKGIQKISPTIWVLFVLFVLRYVQKSL